MRLRFWLGRAGDIAVELLIRFEGVGAFVVGPLPGVHYPDPGLPPQGAPEATHGPDGGGGRTQGPPAGHPERYCATPPDRVEKELWAALGIDVEALGK